MADVTPNNPKDTNDSTPPVLSDKTKVENWLSQLYLRHIFDDDCETDITMRDFTQITLDHGPECYMVGNVISVALALSTEKHNRSDAVVLGEVSALKLYQFAMGIETLAGLNTIPMIRELILDNSKRWIIVPCSDGILEIDAMVDEWNKDFRRQTEQNNKKKADGGTDKSGTTTTRTPDKSKGTGKESKRPAGSTNSYAVSIEKRPEKGKKSQDLGYGTHWGVLLVDKAQNVAHWIDSAVTLEKKGRKLKIEHMFKAGMVAGKILCAIDTIMGTQEGFEKGKFKASTLKYVPQQMRHNTYDKDNGACGSFIFAFMEHLYSNPAKMNNLKASFSKSRRDRLRFNSKSQREEIRRLIQQKVESDTEIPFKLTPEVLHILGLISVQRLEEKLRRFQGVSLLPQVPKSGKSGYGHDNRRDDNDDDDKDPDGTFGDPPVPKAMLWEEIRNDPEAYKGLSLVARFRQAYDKLAEVSLTIEKGNKANKGAKKQTKPKAKTNAKANAKAKVETKGLLPPVPTRHSKIVFPKSISRLPTDFANQKDVSNKQLEMWKEANIEYIEQLNLGRKSNHYSFRAALQVLSGVDFDQETSHRLQNIWIQDVEVFNSDDQTNVLSDKEIARRMKIRYDIGNMESLLSKVDYGNMPVTELRKHITESLKRHKSIRQDREANEYTYRALLFIAAGGRFRNEDQTRLERIWILDSNVFTKGEDYELQKGKPPKLLSVDADRIRAKMQVTYEEHGIIDIFDDSGSDLSSPPETSSEPDSSNNDPPRQHDTSNKRKRSDASNTDGSNFKRPKTNGALPNLDALKETTVNFTRMTVLEIKGWVDLEPIGTSLRHDLPLWHKKAILQKLFGGFDGLSDDDIRYWQDEDPYFNDAKGMTSWSTEFVVPMLRKRVSDIVNSDLRGRLLYYPSSYLDWFAIHQPQKLATTSTTAAKSSLAERGNIEHIENIDINWFDEDKDTSDTDADANEITTTTKRKRNASSPPNDPASKRLRFSTFDFCTMPESDIKLWLNQLPAALKQHVRNSKTSSWIVDQRARVWLTRIYTRVFQDMQAAPKLSREQLATLRKWRNGYSDVVKNLYYPASKTEAMRRFLNGKIMSDRVDVKGEPVKGRNGAVRSVVRTVELPDWSGDRSRWPKVWREGFKG